MNYAEVMKDIDGNYYVMEREEAEYKCKRCKEHLNYDTELGTTYCNDHCKDYWLFGTVACYLQGYCRSCYEELDEKVREALHANREMTWEEGDEEE